ncbi:MAG: CDP-diacylglycerol--serine O-phosphatidyltransferase [Cyclobacteriaceae bacterium]|nr:CDP-diacylglycerol--serine O-phosphatidyltransferase [Cyclobacteriaceae bacterium]
MNIKKYIPNFLTCCNLICGCLGIVYCLEERSIPAAYFVWIAALFDFFDGFAARLLKVHSTIGKELDSLADVVSFGVLPSLVMYKLIASSSSIPWLPYAAFMIAAFSALRLAIFNVDETQRDSFKGLNTPANTLFITSLPLLSGSIASWLHQDWLLVLITIVFSLLMVSPIQFFAFKFKNFSWAENQVRFSFIALSAILLIFLQVTSIPLIILLYIFTSLIGGGLRFKKQ